MNRYNTPIIESLDRRMLVPNKTRTTFMWVLIWVVALSLGGRSFYLQVVKGADFLQTAERNRVDVAVIPAPRGIIYDRNHTQLTENISSTDLVFDPRLLPSEENETYVLEQLSTLIPEKSTDEIRAAITRARKTQQPVLLAKALDHDRVLIIQEQESSLAGVRLVSSLVRQYLYPEFAAHILGYTAPVTAEELEADTTLSPIDSTGKQGIEKSYDSVLRGKNGRDRKEINASGRPQTDLGKEEPIPGQDLQLTIDIELQKFIYALFSERDKKHKEATNEPTTGAAVALDPQTGEILAMVSYPSYDPNAFSQPALSNQTASYFQDALNPLFNRAVDGTFASGSVIKPFIAAAALQEGIINTSTTVLSTGGISVGPWKFPDWKAGGHGVTDVKKAIAESVNTFFYAITGGTSEQPGLGLEQTTNYLGKFGYGHTTGVDLPSEAAGFLPTAAWKKEVKGEPWYIGDTYHLGIGQGDILVTPLQIAMATAGIAQGKYYIEPHFVPHDVKKTPLPISPENVRTIQEAMRQTVTDGSGRSLAELPLPIAGKTGTAQVGADGKTHAWFTSYAPAEDPNIVIAVLLEKGGAGDRDAVPFTKEVWQWWIQNRAKQ